MARITGGVQSGRTSNREHRGGEMGRIGALGTCSSSQQCRQEGAPLGRLVVCPAENSVTTLEVVYDARYYEMSYFKPAGRLETGKITG